jgi:hypothetical protein
MYVNKPAVRAAFTLPLLPPLLLLQLPLQVTGFPACLCVEGALLLAETWQKLSWVLREGHAACWQKLGRNFPGFCAKDTLLAGRNFPGFCVKDMLLAGRTCWHAPLPAASADVASCCSSRYSTRELMRQ